MIVRRSALLQGRVERWRDGYEEELNHQMSAEMFEMKFNSCMSWWTTSCVLIVLWVCAIWCLCSEGFSTLWLPWHPVRCFCFFTTVILMLEVHFYVFWRRTHSLFSKNIRNQNCHFHGTPWVSACCGRAFHHHTAKHLLQCNLQVSTKGQKCIAADRKWWDAEDAPDFIKHHSVRLV